MAEGVAQGRGALSRVLRRLLGPDPPVRVEAWNGASVGPPNAATRVIVTSPDALLRIVTSPDELGFARAYVAGDIDVEGSIFDVLRLRERIPQIRVSPRLWVDLVASLGPRNIHRIEVPDTEIRLRGNRHSKQRDSDAISEHYDVSNDFYEMVLGPSMSYSCALWNSPPPLCSLEDAQWAKMELISQKLALAPDMRMLDIGCGWGSMVIHAAREHGVRAVGVTISREQARWASERVTEEGLQDRVEIRVQDYRDIADGPFEAISSIGMYEHVGEARLPDYFNQIDHLLAPGARVLNHGIAREPGSSPRFGRRGFVDRYVFPDGELHEVGKVISQMQRAGLEVRHSENLREHYALTLRAWVRNLEENWSAAVAEVGLERARIWRLYMAGSALGFEEGRIRIHQVLATRPRTSSSAEVPTMPLRPDWNESPLHIEIRLEERHPAASRGI